MLPIVLTLLSIGASASSLSLPAQSLATSLSLTTSTSIPYPTATQDTAGAASFIKKQWNLSRGVIENGEKSDAISFVDDPFPNSPVPGSSGSAKTGPVLQVTYPAGSYTLDIGGAQIYSLWNQSSALFQTMLLSYEVAFDPGFNWVMGGKLPGVRGGIDQGCSGGRQADGTNCFTSRAMWRTDGAGEAYIYVPTTPGFCNDTNIICNSDFGTSVGRGTFTWASGQWNRLTMLVQLNNPPSAANGRLDIYHNDIQAFTRTDIQFRKSANLTIGGLFISTFFGGSTDDWATPVTTHSYFRNFQLWGSSKPSTVKVKNGSSISPKESPWAIIPIIILLITSHFWLLY